jgi:predicted PurR-regulated permease PerM
MERGGSEPSERRKGKTLNDASGFSPPSEMKFSELETSTRVILKVVLTVLILGFLWVIRDIITTLLLAVVLASAMEPMVQYFSAKKIPRTVSVLTVYILFLGLIGVVIWLLVPPLISQFKTLEANLPQLTVELNSRFPNLSGLFGGANLPDTLKQLASSIGGESALSRTVGVFDGLFTFITVLVVSLYLVAEQKGMRQFIHDVVPSHHQDFTINLIDKIQKKMGQWVLGQLILSLSIFAVTFIGLSLLHVKYALFLAMLAGLLEIVPYIGPILSAVPAVFFALIQSPTLAAAVVVLYILVQKAEGYILVPKIMQKTVGVSPLVVLIAILVGFKLGGILGLLLAVPLAGAITVVIEELSERRSQAEVVETA